MGEAIDFQKARDRAALEKILERSNYHEKIKPIIREAFEKGYDRARDRAQQVRSGQTPEKLDISNEAATGAETIQQNGKTLRAKVVCAWNDPNAENTRTPSAQTISKGTGLDSSHTVGADQGGPRGPENINLFNRGMNRGTFNTIDKQSKAMTQQGDRVLQIGVDYYDIHKEGYGLKKPLYEDRDRAVFPAEGEPRHEQLRPANFSNEKSRAADAAALKNNAAPRTPENSPSNSSKSQAGPEAEQRQGMSTTTKTSPSDSGQSRVDSIRRALGKSGEKSPPPAQRSNDASPDKPAASTLKLGEYRASSARVDAIRDVLKQQRSQANAGRPAASPSAAPLPTKIEGPPAGTTTDKSFGTPPAGPPSPPPPPPPTSSSPMSPK